MVEIKRRFLNSKVNGLPISLMLAGSLIICFFVFTNRMIIDALDDKSIRADADTAGVPVADKDTTTSSASSFALAEEESLGFLKDITKSAWEIQKKRFQLTQPNYMTGNDRLLERHSRYSNHFWSENFEPEFTCPFEFRFGKLGDGGKWVCDSHRGMDDGPNGCLVYSIGSNGNFDFETEVVKHISPECEIHTFDAEDSGRYKNFFEEAKKIPSVTFHHIGLGKTTNRAPHFKPFREIFKELHPNNSVTHIDIMKIDCEKCEYKQFQEWLDDWNESGVLVRQVLLEIHNSDYPVIMDIFKAFQKDGYVLFHKEANYLNEGKSVEVAWIKLSKKFQQN